MSTRRKYQKVVVDGSVAYIYVQSKTHGEKIIAIDTPDLPAVSQHCWSVYKRKNRRSFYAQSRIDGRVVRLHQWLLGNPGTGVDHKDGNGLNNTRENLRPATTSQNNANQLLRSNNTSGHKGVSWHKKDQRWRATITVSSQHRHLGNFHKIEDAIAAYRRAAVEAFGEFAQVG